ncbi:MAG: DNA-binding protein WhiA [Clostridia bacterium]|nr:DNA-binding protein WhiA [Clostridia bacterium]
MNNNLNNDILQGISTTSCCSNAFLSAVISVTKEEISENQLVLTTPTYLYDKFCTILKNFYPELNIRFSKIGLVISGKSLIEMLSELDIAYFNNGTLELSNPCNETMLASECCRITYLKGVFLCVGKIYYNNDTAGKSQGYSIELVFKDYQLADDMKALTKVLDVPLKSVKRGNNIVLYSKDSQVLVDFLVKIGAMNEAFELQNSLVMREMRNDANRKGNCFDANLNKTINASMEQVKAIDYIINNYGLEYLDVGLQDVALLRLSNPDSTLSELQKLYPTGITRAGLKYKLDKIIAIYKDLKGIN